MVSILGTWEAEKDRALPLTLDREREEPKPDNAEWDVQW